MRTTIAIALVISLAPLTRAQDKQSPDALRTAINDLNVLGADFWVYNDLAAAIQQAKNTNKPIFVTFRCVPCKACAGFDAEVAKGSQEISKFARENFVSLRQVEMKGVDLSQFQFDYDLNWAAMFINADGTVYARYGTQSAEGPDAYNSITSLKRTMARVLELHTDYQRVKDSLRAKRGADKPYKTALEMPGLERKEKLAGTTARNNCIHCHMINDAMHNQLAKEGTFSIQALYRYPLPENLGLHIVRDDGREIEGVISNTPAAEAGLASGDVITDMNGQPITSIADMQWVLHNLPYGDAKVDVTVSRNGQSLTKTLALSGDWKKTDFKWRGSRWSVKPHPGFWAPALKDKELSELRKKLEIPEVAKPLKIQWINTGEKEGKVARDAGFKEGDILLTMNGQPMRWDPEAFHMHVRFEHKVGERLAFTVLRDGKTLNLELPLIN
jgi:hypothetical protein